MAVLRSKSVTYVAKSVAPASSVSSIKTEKPVKLAKVAAPPASPKLPRKKAGPKPHIETLYAHIVTPDNLQLPQSFIDFHSPQFVEGCNHVLKIDPSLYPVLSQSRFDTFSKKQAAQIENEDGDKVILGYWYSLVSSVISQQVSGSAARAIKGRFQALFDGKPTPQAALAVDRDTLKAVGLLSMKLNYIVHISEVFSSPDSKLTSLSFYKNCTSEELVAELTKLKGIGEWSARMFAVFTLKDLDIFAYDDLGVARGVARYLEVRPETLKETKDGVHAVEELKIRLKRKSKFFAAQSKRDWVPLHDEYVKFLALKYEPYRLVFMLIMWELSATNIDALEQSSID